jgi:hypothetical protein
VNKNDLTIFVILVANTMDVKLLKQKTPLNFCWAHAYFFAPN